MPPCSRILSLLAFTMTYLAVPLNAAQAQYVVGDLLPAGYTQVVARGTSAGRQVGFGVPPGEPANKWHAFLWSGSASTIVDLTPAGYDYSQALGISGDFQVGGAWGWQSGRWVQRAILWSGSAASAVDLTPSGLSSAMAYGIHVSQIVGSASVPVLDGSAGHALIWSASAGNVVDIHPGRFHSSRAFGTDGVQQVGSGTIEPNALAEDALLWSGTSESVVDLHPGGFLRSEALATSGGQQVGNGTPPGSWPHALLWSGSAASMVDLHPVGALSSRARGLTGSRQVGSALIYGEGYHGYHAVTWTGNAESMVDLHAYLPASFRGGYGSSNAMAIQADGTIAGYAGDVDGIGHPILWIPTGAAPTRISAPVTITARAGQTITISADVASGGTPVVSRTMQVGLLRLWSDESSAIGGGVPIGTAVTDAAGKATLRYTLPDDFVREPFGGAGFIIIEFPGDATYGPARTTTTLTVTRGVPSFSLFAASGLRGQSVLLRTLFVCEGKAVVGRTVQFAVDGVSVGSATSDASGASLAYRIPPDAPPGPHDVTVSFAGDGYYAPASRTAAALSAKAATVLSFYAASGGLGGSAVLKAILFSGSARVTGRRVAFAVDGTAVGSALTDANGVAQVSWAVPLSASVGAHDVTATVAGDGSYATTTRTAAVLSVSKAGTVISLYATSGSREQTVGLRRILLSASTRLPGMTMMFAVDGAPVGSGTTDAMGVAVVPYTILSSSAVGAHNVTASFAGSATYAPTTRAAPALTVR